MPAPGICEGAIFTFLGLILGFDTHFLRCDLRFVVGVGGGGVVVAPALAAAALLRDLAVELRVL